jgi:hypothetical protein
MAFSSDTKLGVLLDSPEAKEILIKHLPEIKNAGPMIAMARGMTLSALSRVASGKITPEKLAAIQADLERL